MNRWISVDDYLPDIIGGKNCSEEVFVISANGGLGVDYYIRDVGWKHDGGPVTHWFPPPEFPDGIKELEV